MKKKCRNNTKMKQINTTIEKLPVKRLLSLLKDIKEKATVKESELEDLDRIILQVRREIRGRRK